MQRNYLDILETLHEGPSWCRLIYLYESLMMLHVLRTENKKWWMFAPKPPTLESVRRRVEHLELRGYVASLRTDEDRWMRLTPEGKSVVLKTRKNPSYAF